MSRRPTDGTKAPGIQAKKGKLFIVVNEQVNENGIIKNKRVWHSTGMDNNPANVRKAQEMREKLLRQRSKANIDVRIKMNEYVDVFLCAKERTVANTTYAAYCQRSQPIKNFFLNIGVKDITTQNIEEFFDKLAETGKYKYRTLKDIKAVFNGIMQKAIKDGLIIENPVTEVTFSKSIMDRNVKADEDEAFFTYQEAILFLNAAKGHELYEFFYVTLFFGLRREEALGIRWSAINLTEKTLFINHTVTKGTQINRLNTTKTSSSKRSYPLSDAQVEMFKRLKGKESKYRKLLKGSYYDSDYVFKHIDGTLYHPDYPSKAFRKIIRNNSDLPQKITLHGLRSSCVSILVHEGLDLKSIQNWVGHADINTTLKVYTKVKNIDSKKEISSGMENIIRLELKDEEE